MSASAAVAAGLAPLMQQAGKAVIGHAAEGVGGAVGGLFGKKGKKIGRKVGRFGAHLFGFQAGGKIRRPPTTASGYAAGGRVKIARYM